MLNSSPAAVLVLVVIIGAASVPGRTEAVPAFTFWFLDVTPPTCNLSTGVCAMSMMNTGGNSSYDLALAFDYCNADLIYAKNSTATYYTLGNGTAGGQILGGIPFGMNLTATCTIPPDKLTLEPNGQPATGFFTLKLVNSLGNIPAGMTAPAEFIGVWFAPLIVTTTQSTTTTVTSTVVSNQISTTTALSTILSTTTTTLTVQSEGVPSLPYQLLIAGLVVVAVVSTLIAVRDRRTK
jgi:hypothetical protein